MTAAIETRYCGPTARRGSRIIATAGNGRRHVIGYDSAGTNESRHYTAAHELAESMGYLHSGRKLVFGEWRNGRYAFVIVSANGDQL